jgi:hypothetical protein
LAVALLFFVAHFLLPGWRAKREMRAANDALKLLRTRGPVVDLDELRNEAMNSEALRHCWAEFRDTLHGQKQPNSSGFLEVSRWRATAMANSFFTEQALVDTALRTEFYKHLPGILTGIGIIGTFSGLILGLQAFGQVNLGDAEQARQGLRALLGTVGGAFIVSGAAIALAMALTTVEKIIINGLYTRVELLCGTLDSLFDAGAGEEYLQRLVEAAETSATQAMQMKESLVTDLKQVLTELAGQQMTTMAVTSADLGHTITASLTDGLKEPLARISDAVQSVSGSQGDAVSRLLTDVLSSFTAQMETMFGGQMRGMSEMLTQTAGTIQQASQRFEQLIGQIDQASSGASQALAQRMDETLMRMQARQDEANDQLRGFVEEIKRSAVSSQSESATLTLSMMRELGASTGALVREMQEQVRHSQHDQSATQREAAEQMRDVVRQLQESTVRAQGDTADATAKLLERLSATTSDTVRGLRDEALAAQQQHDARREASTAEAVALLNGQGEQMARLAEAVQRAEAAMRETVERIKSSTDSHLDRISAGADRLMGASDRLSDNLVLMKSNSDGLTATADRLNTASSTLVSALAATQQALGDQKSVRDALAGMVSDLRSTVENASREASLTTDLVNGIQQASRRLSEAQEVSVASLEDATSAIGDAHGAFAKQVEVTLRDGNRAFHEELAQAVGLLKGAIQDLGDVLDNVRSPT